MFAIDGEYIDFLKKVLLEGPVELWLTTVEEAMRLTLRDQMKQTRLALKKMLDMRDKWLLQYPGQCTLTSSIVNIIQIIKSLPCHQKIHYCQQR